MTANIDPYRGNTGGGALARRATRSIARIEANGSVRLARLEQEADLQAAKISACGYVGSRAMTAVSLLSELERQLAQASPMAVSKLEAISNITSITMAEIVVDTARVIRRI